jgi:type IV pilus assembly protein PilO
MLFCWLGSPLRSSQWWLIEYSYIGESMDLSELSLDRLGSWPVRLRIAILIGIGFFTLALGYLFFIRPRCLYLNSIEKQHSDLKSRYHSAYQQASRLSIYEKQLGDMQKSVDKANQQFILVNEIPQWINTIAKLAIANNVKMHAIKPKQKMTKDFYWIMPVSISATGDYSHLVLFIRQIESLPKTIVFGDLTIAQLNDNKNDDSGTKLLAMDALITVYITKEKI